MSKGSARQKKIRRIMTTFCIIAVIFTIACLMLLIFGDSYNRIRNFLSCGSFKGVFSTFPPELKAEGFRPSEFGNYKLLWDDNFIASWLMSIGIRRYDLDVIEWVIVTLVIVFAFAIIICPYLIINKTIDGKNPAEVKTAKRLYVVVCVIAILVLLALAPVILIK